MQINVQSIHFDADVKLVEFVEQKVHKLDQYYDQLIEGDVYLRLDKSDVNENKVAEIKISMPGRELFARKQCKSFEEAADSAVEALRKQIRKHKPK